MGEWKAPPSLRISQEFRRELEEAAAKERRTLGNLGALLLEWAYELFKVAGDPCGTVYRSRYAILTLVAN
jgi:hypothetical protein